MFFRNESGNRYVPDEGPTIKNMIAWGALAAGATALGLHEFAGLDYGDLGLLLPSVVAGFGAATAYDAATL